MGLTVFGVRVGRCFYAAIAFSRSLVGSISRSWDNTSACVGCYSDFLHNNTEGQFNKMLYAAFKQSFTAAGVTTAEKAVVMAALASSPSACSSACSYDGSTYDSASGWGSTAACSGCLTGNYTAFTDAQLEATLYAAVQAAVGYTTYAEVDDYLEAAVQASVFAYSDATLLYLFQTNV